jgi:hypothetical protein
MKKFRQIKMCLNEAKIKLVLVNICLMHVLFGIV